jgi:parallel beta-helix repeat protein
VQSYFNIKIGDTIKIRKSLFLSCISLPLMLNAWNLSFAAEDRKLCEMPKPEELRGQVELEPSCIYTKTMILNNSNTKVDCRGAILDGKGVEKIGIYINSEGRPLSNVVVKTCIVRNYKKSGVLITSGIPHYKRSNDHEINYSVSPTKVTLDHLNIQGSGGVGVFFHSYVTDSTLSNSTVSLSKGAGIYLEQSSKKNTISNNLIEKNGEWHGPKTGQREGLAIDSSAENLIRGNRFIDNWAGGVFLYKNCGEKFSSGKSIIRWQPSDFNVIENNQFYGEKVGIWVASRQSANLLKSDCGDKSMDAEGKYHQDYASNNKILNNKFCKNKVYIKVEGDHNTIKGNVSDKVSGRWITEPKTMKERITGVPTLGNKISDNRFEACDG